MFIIIVIIIYYYYYYYIKIVNEIIENHLNSS